jgi:hypothetical protein
VPRRRQGLALWALVLFVLAALGGVTLNPGCHRSHRPVPNGPIVGRAGLPVIGFIMRVVVASRRPLAR